MSGVAPEGGEDGLVAALASRGAATKNVSEDGLSPMWYVYIIRSIPFPVYDYTGATEDLRKRLGDHNAGKSTHTAKYKPWKLICYIALPDKFQALALEKYLKSHSGRAFAKKRLLKS